MMNFNDFNISDDIKKAIMNSKNIYPDVIKKSMPEFDKIFEKQLQEEEQEKYGKIEHLSEE